jgi:hypothetical protein
MSIACLDLSKEQFNQANRLAAIQPPTDHLMNQFTFGFESKLCCGSDPSKHRAMGRSQALPPFFCHS